MPVWLARPPVARRTNAYDPSAQNQTAPSRCVARRGAWPSQRTATQSAVMHRMSDLPKSEAAFERPSSRHRAVSDELRKKYFPKLIRPGKPFRLTKLTACQKWGVCIGATVPSQADMGIKARWRKRFRPSAWNFCVQIQRAQAEPGSRPMARMSRFASSVAMNTMKARANALFRPRDARPAA